MVKVDVSSSCYLDIASYMVVQWLYKWHFYVAYDAFLWIEFVN